MTNSQSSITQLLCSYYLAFPLLSDWSNEELPALQSQQGVLWHTSPTPYVTSANRRAEARTAWLISGVGYKNYIGQGNTHALGENFTCPTTLCLEAGSVYDWVGPSADSRTVLHRGSVCKPWHKDILENWRSTRYTLQIWDSGAPLRKAVWKWL